MPRRRSSAARFAALLLLPLVSAQLLSSTLPSCATQCTLLQQAQGSCESNPASAQSCFCQSSLLAGINTSSNNLCTPACDSTDWATIQTWYKSFCANGGNNAAQGGTTGTTTTTQAGGPTVSPTTAAAAAATTSNTPATQSGTAFVNQNQTGVEWWNTHWQWIVMLIILVIGFTAIGVGGRIWYRRRHKKVDGEIVDVSEPENPPDMGMWAPSRHSVHDFSNTNVNNTDYNRGSTIAPLPPARQMSGKGKHREGTRPLPARTPSQRLKRAMENVQM